MPVITIPFGPYEPDAAFLNTPQASVVAGVYAAPNGYTPANGANSTRSANLAAYDTFLGGVLIKTAQTTFRVYLALAASSTRSIRSYDNGSFASSYTGTEVGTGFAANDSNELWRFAKFGNFLIAVQDNVDPQVLNWSSAGSFGALGGSPPRASGVFVIHDFVFLTGLASNRRKLQWSAINDHTGWTVGTNLSDEQEFQDGYDICGIAGGVTGYVIQKQAIRTYQFLPGDTERIFSFSKLEGVPGCANLDSWAYANQTVYYVSEEGFCSIGPQGFRRIGAHRVDSATRNSSILTWKVVADPFKPLIYFKGPSFLVYDYQLDRWVVGPTDSNIQHLVDHIEATGGATQMVASVSGIQPGLYTTDGSKLAGGATTSDLQIFNSGPNAGKRAEVRRVRPIINGAVASVSVSHKESLDDAYVTATSTTQESNGWFNFGSAQTSGVYHKLSAETSAANSATYWQGLEVDVIPAGEA